MCLPHKQTRAEGEIRPFCPDIPPCSLWKSGPPQVSSGTLPDMSIPLLAPHVQIAWRDATNLILEDPAAPHTQIHVGNATPNVVRWLRSCNGSRSLDEVLSAAPTHGLATETARELLDLLAEVGLMAWHAPDRHLAEDWSIEAKSPLHHDLEALALCGLNANRALELRQQHHVVIEGSNRVAHALVDLLAAAHIGSIAIRGQHISRRLVTLRDVGPFGPTAEDVGLPPSIAMRRHIDRVMVKRPQKVRRPVVVLCDAHSDPGDEMIYRTAGVPYLRILATSRFATIGPLTLPGQTVCWSCIALYRSDADPHWPHLLAQFDQHRRGMAPIDSTFAMWVASESVARLLHVIDSDDPQTLVNTSLHIDRTESTIRRRVWRVHPDCPCQWSRDLAA